MAVELEHQVAVSSTASAIVAAAELAHELSELEVLDQVGAAARPVIAAGTGWPTSCPELEVLDQVGAAARPVIADAARPVIADATELAHELPRARGPRPGRRPRPGR